MKITNNMDNSTSLFEALGSILKPQKCSCINVEFGTYENQVVVIPPDGSAMSKAMSNPDKRIGLDRCIAEEVQQLWNLGITTTGCCCGHNKADGYIGVIDSDIPKMKAMGYEVVFNNIRPNDEDSFKPKSI